MSRHAALPCILIGAAAVLVIAFSVPPKCSAQGQPAVVEGTSQLFIRRGPGREFPPFATLTGGSQVQLQERHGTWARVTTASGQVGYVHSKYLRVLKADTPVAAPAPPTAPVTTAPTPATAAPTPAAGSPTRTTRSASTSTPQRVVERATERATASPTASAEVTSTPAATETPGTVAKKLRGANVEVEIGRLSEAVEALNRRLDQRFPLPEAGNVPAPEPDSGVSGGAILLSLAGVVVGWLLGSTYQRNKERGRRSRIRL